MTEEEHVVARILDVLPPGSFELSTFLSLFRIQFSNAVKSAAVTCSDAPTLLLNRDFIAAYCHTDEHLFMLVLHELYHVILGHTSLFPRATKVRNLVFDAVINAILCSLFPDPAFTSFFTDYYPADEMPYALLRPRGGGTPRAAEMALRLLYDTSGTGTYHDVYEALLASGCVKEVAALLSDGAAGKPILIGSHDAELAEAEVSQEMKELLDAAIAKWPSPDRPLKGRDLGSGERTRDFGEGRDSSAALRRGVARLLHRAAQPGPQEARIRAVRQQMVETATFRPTCRDRTHAARESLWGEVLLYRDLCPMRRPESRDRRQAFVYFDVSGSVADKVPDVAAALLPHVRRGRCRVHVFSTVVRAATVRDLIARQFDSTGGTDIGCVLRHVLDLPRRLRPRAVVLITDGFVGVPDAELAHAFRAAGLRLFVGLVGADTESHQQANLSSLATAFIKLD